MTPILLTVWFGTVSGVLLALIAPEEMIPGKRWLRIFYCAVSAFTAGAAFWHPLGSVALVAGAAAALIGWYIPRVELSYTLFALMVAGFPDQTGLAAVSGFIMGMPAGTLASIPFMEKKTWYQNMYGIRWFIPSLVLTLATTLLY